MAIKDLDKYHLLIQEWNDVVNASIQADAWIKDMINKISILQADLNFLPNASPQEIQFLTSWATLLNNFLQSEPINPDKI